MPEIFMQHFMIFKKKYQVANLVLLNILFIMVFSRSVIIFVIILSSKPYAKSPKIHIRGHP